jgi:hypothetical protein
MVTDEAVLSKTAALLNMRFSAFLLQTCFCFESSCCVDSTRLEGPFDSVLKLKLINYFSAEV